jgi:dCTP deaminase
MKATIKFRGLVNVSGFHVDPGFAGQLTFAVFNAGPRTVHLQQGQQCFLIWYADLNSTSGRIKREPVRRGIDSSLISNISGQLHSLEGLANKITHIEEQQRFISTVVVGIAIGAVVAVIGFGLSLFRSTSAPVQVIVPGIGSMSSSPSAVREPTAVPTPGAQQANPKNTSGGAPDH